MSVASRGWFLGSFESAVRKSSIGFDEEGVVRVVRCSGVESNVSQFFCDNFEPPLEHRVETRRKDIVSASVAGPKSGRISANRFKCRSASALLLRAHSATISQA